MNFPLMNITTFILSCLRNRLQPIAYFKPIRLNFKHLENYVILDKTV